MDYWWTQSFSGIPNHVEPLSEHCIPTLVPTRHDQIEVLRWGFLGVWVGDDQKDHSIIILNLKYLNKQNALIPNMAARIVHAN